MAAAQVRRRRVFYIPGYDPIPPRRYRELYRAESAIQGALRGHEIALRPRRKGERFGWGVDARIEGETVEIEFEVLVWSDIVRSSMGPGIASTYWQMCRTAWVYASTGALWRLMGLRKGPVIAALYPVAMLLAQLLAALLVALGLAWGVGAVAPNPLGVLVGIAGFVVVLRWFRKKDGKFFAYYLMHDYGFSARFKGANPPALEARMADFAGIVATALADDIDEVLVVGHSSGAHIAVSVLADLIRAGKVPPTGPCLSFLSLGQVVPMVSFLPDAHRLRADLGVLGSTRALAWVDVSAPGDGCAFALCDPVAVSGVAVCPRTGPLILSAAFTQTLQPETWARLRRRYFRLHFQYLCAFDNLPKRRDAYDYFAVTAGPLTLAERFATRTPSRSLIDRPASRYTSTAA
ncbi:hypothetical protein [Palleronia sp.]|uniref:hypothetical protein n=1 Tax=Palleronia sp. TaxID=1940284 RepID=UPI0035C873A6